jgi:uncharacterized protein YgiM (DUF1202 family)
VVVIFDKDVKMKLQLSLVITMLALGLSAQAASTEMSVQVVDASVRSSATALGAVAATLHYGDRVTVLETKGSWMKVQSADSATTGWVHQSALVKGEINMEAGDTKAETKASSEEMAAATKGFNSKVEADFKAKNADIDFSWVDKMEGFGVPTESLLEFIRSGGLSFEEGGAK